MLDYVVRLDGQGLVVGGADSVAVAMLAQIEGAVLVPHDRMACLAGLSRKLRDRADAGVLVLHRVQGYRHAGHPPDLRAPYSGGADQQVRANAAPVRDHGPDAPPGHLDIRHACTAWKATPDAWASLAIASAALTALPIPSDGT